MGLEKRMDDKNIRLNIYNEKKNTKYYLFHFKNKPELIIFHKTNLQMEKPSHDQTKV